MRDDLLFDARHIAQSGIGTYIGVQIPALEEVLGRDGRTLAVLADHGNVPDVAAGTEVVYAEPAGAAMFSLGEQRAWDHAIGTVRPRAFWTPHFPHPLTLLRPRHRKVLAFSTVHDDNYLLP